MDSYDNHNNYGPQHPSEDPMDGEKKERMHDPASDARTNYPVPQPSPKKPVHKNSKNNYVGMILSGIVGGIIAAITVLLLASNQIIPIDLENSDQNFGAGNGEEAEPEVIETLAAEDAEVSTDISEVSKAVVGVVNMQQQSIWTESEEAGTGSGIIYKKEDGKAYVVTNHHVVDGAQQVEIVLNEEERYPATVLGSDELNDLAVLEMDGKNIDTVANFGSSSDLQVGETALAIGNPLGLEFANTVTRGIISGLDRSVNVDTNGDGVPDWVTEVIQTDAAINPGNSGGALVNADGEVIGINSMKIAQGAVEGIGFAIPTDTALPIMQQLEEDGEITRPQIGVTIASIYQVPPQYRHEINVPEEVEEGVVIANVEPGSPADKAGLEQFDVITKINDQPITNMLELRKYLYSEANVGETVTIEFARDGKLMTTDLTLTARESNNE